MSAFTDVYSFNNLKLAWKRIRSGQNISYKRYFREIFDAYSLSLKENLQNLSKLLRECTYQPIEPQRIMMPKSSGLQRPITLLSVEDQIVLQAIANIYAQKLRKRKQAVDSTVVCSNRLVEKPSSVFFFKPWKDSHALFKSRVFSIYEHGYRFVADFDLSSFYDTISHDLLVKVFSPQNGNREFCSFLKNCLKRWTANDYSHGIPQGPIASDFLAECVMISIDEEMQYDFKYVRYVDDIRILGKDDIAVRRGVVKLERLCRDRGLIPHSGKYRLRYAKSKYEALGKMPSLKYADENLNIENNKDEANKAFLNSLTSRRERVVETSRLKYVLYRAEPNDELLRHVLKIMPRHPELIDVFLIYLAKFGVRRKISNRLLYLLQSEISYEYVEGEYWGALSISCCQRQLEQSAILAIERHRELSHDSISIRLGIYRLLSNCQNANVMNYLYKSLAQEPSSTLQAYALSQLTDISKPMQYLYKLLKNCLESAYVEPGIVAAWYVGIFRIDWKLLKIDEKKISIPARNTLEVLEIIKREKTAKPNSLSILVSRRFQVQIWDGWKKILNTDYKHSHRLLVMAEKEFDESPSTWMGCMDSFNDLVTRNFLQYLASKYPTYTFPKTVNSKGELVDYGSLLEPQSYIARNIPALHSTFNDFHKRRNALPTSHAKDKKTQTNNKPLKFLERKKYINMLEQGYQALFAFFASHGL